MPYGKPKTYRRKYTKKPVKKTYKKRTGMSKKGITSLVKKVVAMNIENKISNNVQSSASIISIPVASGTANVNYYVSNPYTDGLFTLQQGTGQSQRIGNTIKLKRWVIKGSLYYDPAFNTSENLAVFPQQQMYVDLYFGRRLNMTDTVTDSLTDLYQNGATDISPAGMIEERTYSINKDEYKIYWHRRYKIGANPVAQVTGGNPGIGNNDYSLNKEFGFDVCKLVCKNKKLKFDSDTDVATANDALVSSLTLWAVGTMPNNNLGTISLTEDFTFYSPARIQTTSYIEYEDA